MPCTIMALRADEVLGHAVELFGGDPSPDVLGEKLEAGSSDPATLAHRFELASALTDDQGLQESSLTAFMTSSVTSSMLFVASMVTRMPCSS